MGVFMTTNADISGGWIEPISSRREQSSPDRAPGQIASSMVKGAVAGMLGGGLALAVTDRVANGPRFLAHVNAAVAFTGTAWVWLGAAAACGMVVGALFGGVTRRLIPIVPRVVFGAIFVPAAWTALYAFVLPRCAPWVVAHVAFAPALLGALVYGLCVAVARPSRPRPSKFEWFEAELAADERVGSARTESFPLTRRRA